MIFSHFSNSTLRAHLKNYSVLINSLSDGPSKSNLEQFRDQCKQELERRTNNVRVA